MLAVTISSDISNLFQALNIPGNRDKSDHITMFSFESDLPIKKICKIIPLVYEVTKDLKPFVAESSKIISFPQSSYGKYPIIAEIKSNKLKNLRNKIAKIFDDNKIDYSKKFPVYKPHLTVSYNDEKLNNINFSTIKFNINNIALYGGDNGQERLFVSFPFNLGVKKSSEYINHIANLYKLSSI